jgi:hypothetical protein
MGKKKNTDSEWERDRELDRAAVDIMRTGTLSFPEAYKIALDRRDAEEKRAAARPPDDAEPGDLFK